MTTSTYIYIAYDINTGSRGACGILFATEPPKIDLGYRHAKWVKCDLVEMRAQQRPDCSYTWNTTITSDTKDV